MHRGKLAQLIALAALSPLGGCSPVYSGPLGAGIGAFTSSHETHACVTTTSVEGLGIAVINGSLVIGVVRASQVHEHEGKWGSQP